MKDPENQKQLVLWYLINWKTPFSLKDVINDSMFFKFQTRLSDIELEDGEITKKTRKTFTNRFGRPSSYLVYEAKDLDLIKKLYNLY